MKFRIPILSLVLLQLSATVYAEPHATSNPDQCRQSKGPALQVLGSGGPIADDGRASSAYLVWTNGQSRFLIDAGGGAFLRFGEAGADFKNLDHIGISHFHTDHSTDLVALLKSGYFSPRERSLSISGPAAGGDYPGMQSYLDRLLNSDTGVYAYLNGYLDGSEGLVKLDASDVNTEVSKPVLVFADTELDTEIFAFGVPHGPVPALAYRIRVGDRTIVFSGDHNGSSDAFIDFARGANILVMHMPVPEKISGVGRKLHAPPSIIGKIANSTGADTLVLSHFMSRSLYHVNENLRVIQSHFKGPIHAARDLDCFIL